MKYCLYIIFFFFITNNNAFALGNPSYFNTLEIESDNLTPFVKWDRITKSYKNEAKRSSGPDCKNSRSRECNIANWENFLSERKGKGKLDNIKAVHKYINSTKYIVDIANWGIDDYWATPSEFLIKDGDCEDYAIAKYYSLIRLGFHDSEMRIVILNDKNLKLLHSVLIVKMNGKDYMLDNQISQVVEAKNIHHYQPIYSINKAHWWLHKS